MDHCPDCGENLERCANDFACVKCEHWWAGTSGPWPFHYSVCVACGHRIIDSPNWLNNHKCPLRHDASRGEREFSERGRTFSDRLKDGFEKMGEES